MGTWTRTVIRANQTYRTKRLFFSPVIHGHVSH
jgi:hypothetical protein